MEYSEGIASQFLRAKDRLRELAKGRYHSVQYELTEYSSGKLAESCRLVVEVEGEDIVAEGTSFKESLNMIEQRLRRFEEPEVNN
jgi:hypothetical protein